MVNLSSSAPTQSPALSSASLDSTVFLRHLRRAHPASTWVAAGGLVLLIAFLYARIGAKLLSDWIQFPDYSHGLLIPFFFLFLLWDKRTILEQTPVRPSWAGVPLVAFALLVMLTGVFGADLFLARFSFVLLSAGLVWTLLGYAMLSRWPFLLFTLVLAIPLPAVLLNHITFPLQIFASSIAGDLLPLAGVPVLREGNVINLPAMPLEVAEACSGIRSLMSLFTIAVIYGYLLERRTLIRVLLAVAAVPIAVAANVVRIIGTGLCVQYWDPEKALGFFHEFSGWVMFLISLVCLYCTHQGLHLVLPQKKQNSPRETESLAA